MKLLLRYCGKTLLLGPPHHWYRCACSTNLRFSRVLHSSGQTNKSSGSAVLSETSNLPTKYETKAVTQLERLDFDDPMQAYRSKTSWEIARALIVLKLCSVNFLVERNMQVSLTNIIYFVVSWCPTVVQGFNKTPNIPRYLPQP